MATVVREVVAIMDSLVRLVGPISFTDLAVALVVVAIALWLITYPR